MLQGRLVLAKEIVNPKALSIAAINKFGRDYQLRKCVEELNELAVAVSQFMNKPNSIQLIENVYDEMADVKLIMLHLENIFKNKTYLYKRYQYKRDKLAKKVYSV